MRTPPMLFALSLLLWPCGCATILSGTKQPVNISTVPNTAEINIDGAPAQPGQNMLDKGRAHTVTAEAAGYQPATAQIASKVSVKWHVIDLLLAGLIGNIVDFATGAGNELSPDSVHLQLRPVAQP